MYLGRFFMALSQAVITRQMVLAELIKAGINREIADDLSYRYYKNELTYKDIEYLENNFNLKLEMLERSLKTEIEKVKDDLNNKIDNKFTELDNKIHTVENNLNVKIDNKFTELDNKIDKVRDELKSDLTSVRSEIASVNNEVALIRKDMEINKIELDSKLDKSSSELKGTLKLHGWMSGTLITLNVGIFLTLISIVYSLLNK
ncbi:BDR-repeat family protein (plasmid) [Borrelia miyamotoi FR64b]|nr:BDR-repeat family protein [Borrelia miyamotoi FR64b]